MTIDPQAAAHLDMIKSWGLPPVEEIPAAELRRIVEDATPPSHEPVHEITDSLVPGPHGDIPIRVYRPEGRDGLPVAAYLHGGGWVMCSIDSHDDLCRRLANLARCLVVSIGYRRSPEHKFPVALSEAYAVLGWLVDNAPQFGGDGSVMAVCGDSVGGNLATAAALMARDRGGPQLCHQLLIYPVIDDGCDRPSMQNYGEGYGLNRSTMRWFWEQYLRAPADAADPYAVPLRAASLAGLPDATIVLAGYDPLLDEGEAYAAALLEAGTSATVLRYPRMIHGFLQYADTIDEARPAMHEVSAALQRALSPVSP